MSDQYYYCLVHKTVEVAEGCKAEDRLGPYPSRAEAQQALAHVAERNEAWDNDPRWNDDEDDDGDDKQGWGPFKS
ncbi:MULTISPECIES: hypothetical protein [Aestuariimicrobium]|uniref:hypothetical protein n=1 Tax=Aestuariimicrobium TaxID=396388 RepID=UPI0003B37C7A|nr:MULTISPECIES: hypothetical protein [Aestuariimicrobium]CAI9400015.1 hypothetical protein AESSP_00306 [Aestuariimicrobium sp. T2.26MG-19.2B]